MPRKSITKKSTVKNKKGEEKSTTILLPTNEEKFLAHYHSYNKITDSARRWMWLSVSLFALAIIFLWGWAMSYRISNINWQAAAQKGIVGQAKNNWNQIFADTKKKEDLKQQIASLLSRMAVPTSTLTTTIADVATTSPAQVNSTATLATTTINN